MCLQISKKWNESRDMIQSSKEKFFYFFHLWYHEWTCSRNPASSLTGSRMIKKIPFLNEICKEMNLQKLLLLTWIIWSEFPTFPGEKIQISNAQHWRLHGIKSLKLRITGPWNLARFQALLYLWVLAQHAFFMPVLFNPGRHTRVWYKYALFKEQMFQ